MEFFTLFWVCANADNLGVVFFGFFELGRLCDVEFFLVDGYQFIYWLIVIGIVLGGFN